MQKEKTENTCRGDKHYFSDLGGHDSPEYNPRKQKFLPETYHYEISKHQGQRKHYKKFSEQINRSCIRMRYWDYKRFLKGNYWSKKTKRKLFQQISSCWRTPWTKEPCGLQCMGLQRAGHDWATKTFTFSPFFFLLKFYTIIYH